MSSYVPRTSAPSLSDPNFINYSYGGNNYCIAIDTITGYVMPNCTGYAWGRWRELLGTYHNLSTGNATNWYGHTSDGYQRGSSVRLGAVACWSGGSDGLGHVAIVEAIDATGYYISNSAYNAYMFQYQHISGNYFGSLYTFQGFIYIPLIFDNDDWLLAATRKKKKMKVVIK